MVDLGAESLLSEIEGALHLGLLVASVGVRHSRGRGVVGGGVTVRVAGLVTVRGARLVTVRGAAKNRGGVAWGGVAMRARRLHPWMVVRSV